MKKLRKQELFVYASGEELRVNDKVIIEGCRRAIVERILRKKSKEARDYYVEEEGGFLLRFEAGGYEVWLTTDDEIQFVGRGD